MDIQREGVSPKGRGPHHRLSGYVWEKWCNSCCSWREFTVFYPRLSSKDGLRADCKLCNASKTKVGFKRWWEANVEYKREQNRKWREKNIEHIRAYGKEYRKQNPDVLRQHRDKRRALEMESSSGYVDYGAVRERDAMLCHLCGYKVEEAELHFDHVIPLSRGGEHSMDNIKVSHAKCNLRKGSRLMEELTWVA